MFYFAPKQYFGIHYLCLLMSNFLLKDNEIFLMLNLYLNLFLAFLFLEYNLFVMLRNFLGFFDYFLYILIWNIFLENSSMLNFCFFFSEFEIVFFFREQIEFNELFCVFKEILNICEDDCFII